MRKSDHIPEELAESVTRIGERVQVEVLELLRSHHLPLPTYQPHTGGKFSTVIREKDKF